MSKNSYQYFAELIQESIEVKERLLEDLLPQITQAAQTLSTCLLQEKKILICGNGGSAADAQHFAAELVNRFSIDRPPLPALALTTDSSILTSIANDFDFNQVFAKQVEALGSEGDVLIVISTSGNSENLLRAMQKAIAKGMKIIALSGKDGGKMAEVLDSNLEIRIPSDNTARIQESHLLVLHLFCHWIDKQLFGIE